MIDMPCMYVCSVDCIGSVHSDSPEMSNEKGKFIEMSKQSYNNPILFKRVVPGSGTIQYKQAIGVLL